MGLLDTILGRSKPVQADLDALFALPSAALTLQSAAGMTCSGRAGVCYKPPSGQGFEDMQTEVMKLLGMDGAQLRKVADSFGYQWLVVEDADIEALVTQVHMVNSSLSDAGWGPQLLCSVFGLSPSGDDAGAAGEASGSDTGSATTPSTAETTAPAAADDPVTVGPGRVRTSTAFLVYLFKRGTFYPFVPDGKEKRDTEAELRLRSLVGDDLAVEPDLSRWFPLWDLPVG
jgi:hypothetical protein